MAGLGKGCGILRVGSADAGLIMRHSKRRGRAGQRGGWGGGQSVRLVRSSIQTRRILRDARGAATRISAGAEGVAGLECRYVSRALGERWVGVKNGLAMRRRGAVLLTLALVAAPGGATVPKTKPKVAPKTSAKTTSSKAAASKKSSAASKSAGKAKVVASSKGKAAPKLTHAETEAAGVEEGRGATIQTVRLNSAFVATASLRPMAQNLASFRTAAGYTGVTGYAAAHPGIQAATAYLALGHAYMLDHRYGDAANAYRQAAADGETLSDYTDYLGAQALMQEGQYAQMGPLLDHFADRHPESIFNNNAPVLLANADLQQHTTGAAAVTALEPLAGTPMADHADFTILTLARAYQAAGDNGRAVGIYRSIYNGQPLTFEATQALVAAADAGAGAECGGAQAACGCGVQREALLGSGGGV